MENKRNCVTLNGTVIASPVLEYEKDGESFYRFYLQVVRISGASDEIPVVVSERTEGFDEIEYGAMLTVKGQYCSHNQIVNEEKTKLILFVFADAIETIFSIDDDDPKNNEVFLYGTLCKKPVYRQTPLGREITDMLVAVNRPGFTKSDYIPCICWGKGARCAKELEVGDKVFLDGRVQSRAYHKKLEDGTVETRTAYEVSVRKFEKEEGFLEVL